MKLCYTDRELGLVNKIACFHVCVSTSPHRRQETSYFRRLPHPLAMVTSLMDGPFKLFGHLT